MNNIFRNTFTWVALGFAALLLFNLMQSPPSGANVTELRYSELVSNVKKGNVSSVTIDGQEVQGTLNDSRQFTSFMPWASEIVSTMIDNNVDVTVIPTSEEETTFFGTLLSWFPMLLLIGVWIFFMRQMQNSNGRAMGYGKSRAKLLQEDTERVTFDDVAGVDEAKEDLTEIVDFLRDPRKFHDLGGKIPRGALLIGPPGTGKTLLARSVAGEANVPFFTISGSDFVEMFVGVGASRVRDMFAQAKKNSPCIIFIDEIDAVGRHRGAGLGGGNDEREQTLNQLLVEMDGFDSNEGIILIAATNRPDVLDPALLRPGRFDRQVVVPKPDILGRERILRVHMARVTMAKDVDAKTIAKGTPGFSGADLANLVNEAALLAARRNQRFITHAEFEDAKDKVMMGAERKSMVMGEEEKRLTAYHEAGHALVALREAASDPVHKATIIPRGRALGMVMRLPQKDLLSVTRARLEADLAVAMGGRVAEELIFGRDKVTSGASSDIKMATQIARAMVTEYGMSDKLGPLSFGENEQEVFLGHSVSRTQNHSEQTQRAVDQEIFALVDTGLKRATKVLTEEIDNLHTLAKGLLEYETLSGAELQELLDGKLPNRDESSAQASDITSIFPDTDQPETDKESSMNLGNPQPQGSM